METNISNPGAAEQSIQYSVRATVGEDSGIRRCTLTMSSGRMVIARSAFDAELFGIAREFVAGGEAFSIYRTRVRMPGSSDFLLLTHEGQCSVVYLTRRDADSITNNAHRFGATVKIIAVPPYVWIGPGFLMRYLENRRLIPRGLGRA